MQRKNKKWDFETVAAEAKKHKTRKKFQVHAPGAYNWAQRNRCLDEVCAHMEPGRKSWDLESVTAEAKKYDARTKFEDHAPSSYRWAQRNGYLDVVCAHMVPVRKLWDLKTVLAAAKECKTRTEFRKKYPGAADWASDHGRLDEVCAHMPKKLGYNDKSFSWVTLENGDQWEPFRAELEGFIKVQSGNIGRKLSTLKHFTSYLLAKHSDCCELKNIFRPNAGITNEAYKKYYEEDMGNTFNDQVFNPIVDFLDHIILNHFTEKDDYGRPTSSFTNPLERIQRRGFKRNQTVYTAMPYEYMKGLRNILCPYPRASIGSEQPWIDHHFSDWTWAHNNLRDSDNTDWIIVDESMINEDDPDCVWRIGESGEAEGKHQIWSPSLAMFYFIKLHTPLRNAQVRLLDSGEADEYRYNSSSEELFDKNKAHSFVEKGRAQGLFKRKFNRNQTRHLCCLYINSNKTQDQNKDKADRGYVMPWEHKELLYWAEKLRNWQEKYNPIDNPVKATELKKVHIELKSDIALKQMGSYCFLLRKDDTPFPLTRSDVNRPWYKLLSKFEEDLADQGKTTAAGNRIRFVNDYADEPLKTESSKTQTLFPLHSLRVSLLTCLMMDSELPLQVISKLIAGHAGILMTIHYNAITADLATYEIDKAIKQIEDKAPERTEVFLETADYGLAKRRCVTIDSEFVTLRNIDQIPPQGIQRRPNGICLAGGNVHRLESKANGCWNGGEPTGKTDELGLVRGGAGNCACCRHFATDVTFLPALSADVNVLTHRIDQANKAKESIEADIDALEEKKYQAEIQGEPFIEVSQLNDLEREHDQLTTQVDELIVTQAATFNLISHIIGIEKQRDPDDARQKLVVNGGEAEISNILSFTDEQSEILKLSLLCEDAEVFPHIRNELRKTGDIRARSAYLDEMLDGSGFEFKFWKLTEDQQLMVGNQLIRQMAKQNDPDNRILGFKKATAYLEKKGYCEDNYKQLNSAVKEIAVVSLGEQLLSHDLSKLLGVDE